MASFGSFYETILVSNVKLLASGILKTRRVTQGDDFGSPTYFHGDLDGPEEPSLRHTKGTQLHIREILITILWELFHIDVIQHIASLVTNFEFLEGRASKVLDEGRFSSAGNSDEKDNNFFVTKLFDLRVSLLDKLSELFDIEWLKLPHYFFQLCF